MLQHKVSLTADRDCEFNPVIHGGKLFQQWAVDSYLQVESNIINFVKTHQHMLKAEQYHCLADHLQNAANAANAQVGSTVTLPSSFQSSLKNMQERYQDVMDIGGIYGPPDIILTITCNPKCQEIREKSLPGQSSSERPDLVARVFNIKLHELLNDIIKKHIFGRVTGYCYTIEFQKRGLPHAHLAP
uniref:Helitron helicase-like domain-containing protein n=1 Tax=Octopus bimaculoides TaxID=37653 RepID=A0A0L8GSB4_OCTBM